MLEGLTVIGDRVDAYCEEGCRTWDSKTGAALEGSTEKGWLRIANY